MQDRASHVRSVVDTRQNQLRRRVEPAADRRTHDVSRLSLHRVGLDAGEFGQLPSLDQRVAVARGRDDPGAGPAGLPRGCGHHDLEAGRNSCGSQRDETRRVDAVVVGHQGLASRYQVSSVPVLRRAVARHYEMVRSTAWPTTAASWPLVR